MIDSSNCKIQDGKLLVKSAVIAELEGVTTKTIRSYREQGMPGLPQAWFDYLECRAWIKQFKQKDIQDDRGINWKAEMQIAEARLKRAKAEREEIELRKLKNETITIKEAKKDLLLFLNSLKNYLINLPESLMHIFEQYIPQREAFGVFEGVRKKIDDTINGYIEKLEKDKL